MSSLINARKAASSPSPNRVPACRSCKPSSPHREPANPFLTPRCLDPLFSTTSNFLFPQLLSFHIHTNCPPGVGVPKANGKRNSAKIRPAVPTPQRSNVLTSLESHPCAIVPPKSHGITSLYENIGGWGAKQTSGERCLSRATIGSRGICLRCLPLTTYDLQHTTASFQPICRLLPTHPLRENRGRALLTRGQTP